MPTLLTEREAAQLLGKNHHTLAIWRCTKRYPLPFVKIGGSIRYLLSDVEAFIESGRAATANATAKCLQNAEQTEAR
jgi:predicted DNA-binding transcriptional regulator AlpA